MKFLRELWKAIRHVRGKADRPNQWPRCPGCRHRVPYLCTAAEQGAKPCGDGLACGCCTGPHKPDKPQLMGADDGETSA